MYSQQRGAGAAVPLEQKIMKYFWTQWTTLLKVEAGLYQNTLL